MSPKRKIEGPSEQVTKKARTSDVRTPALASFRSTRTIASISGRRAETNAPRTSLTNELVDDRAPRLNDVPAPPVKTATPCPPLSTITPNGPTFDRLNLKTRSPGNTVFRAEDLGNEKSGNEESNSDDHGNEEPDDEDSDNEDVDANIDIDCDRECCGIEHSIKEDSAASISSLKTPSLSPGPNFTGLSRDDLEQMSKAALIDYILDVQGNYVELPPLHIPKDTPSSQGSNWYGKVTVAMDAVRTMDVDEILLDSLAIR